MKPVVVEAMNSDVGPREPLEHLHVGPKGVGNQLAAIAYQQIEKYAIGRWSVPLPEIAVLDLHRRNERRHEVNHVLLSLDDGDLLTFGLAARVWTIRPRPKPATRTWPR